MWLEQVLGQHVSRGVNHHTCIGFLRHVLVLVKLTYGGVYTCAATVAVLSYVRLSGISAFTAGGR